MLNIQNLGGLLSPFSEAEMERRLAGGQKILKDLGLDCIILYGYDDTGGGAIKYFTEITPSANGVYGILPKEGKVFVTGHASTGTPLAPPQYTRVVEESKGLVFGNNLGYTSYLFIDQMLEWLNKLGCKRIGIYRPHIVPYLLVESLKENIDGIELVTGIDDDFDYLKSVKSEEELEVIRHIVDIHDKVYASLECFVRPGRLERDVTADIKKICLDMGCESVDFIMISTGNPYARHKFFLSQNDIIKPGDTIDLLVELSGVGGYWGELSRMWCLGEPSPELIKSVEDNFKIQAKLAEMAKPGVKAITIREEMLKFQSENGYYPERRFFGHSMGIDMVDRPAYVIGETMEFRENMYLSIHPGLETDTIWTMNTDNYIVTKDGAKLLNKTPQKLYLA